MKTEKELREVEIKYNHPGLALNKAYFHRWCEEPYSYEVNGWFGKTYALIELKDGHIHLIEPTQIRFIDRKQNV